ncbi:MAG: Zn-dependent metalloprotease, partial [Bacteroidia bacterium]
MARRGIIFQLLCILQAQMTSNKTSMLMFKNFTKGLLLLIAISSYSVSNGQDVFRIATKNVVHIENDDLSKEVPIILNSVFNVGPNKIPWFAEFENPQQWTPEEFIAWYNKKFGLSTSWKLLRETKDDLGFVHKRYQQYQVNNGMQELIVNNGTLNLHYKNNLLESFNGEIYDAQVDFIPLMNPDFKSVLSSRNQTIQEGSEPTLCYARDDSKGLGFVAPCWKLVLENKENNTLDVVFVSAIEFNKIVREEPQHIHADVTATASTYYIGTRKMITDSISSTKYRLRENIRPISTYNGAVGVDFFNSSKTWNSSTEKIATDVHFSTGLMHDFFKNKLGWDSYANHGDTIASIINLNSGGNAFWSLANNTATFLAKQNGSINPCASIDVVGHEFGHGTADEAAGLVYTGESCMLHESFADIQGTLLEWYLDSTKYNWLLGELVFSGGIRNMQDPKSMNHPDTYGGQFFPNGCHGSGEVQNYWFYLMVKGDTGTNDNA